MKYLILLLSILLFNMGKSQNIVKYFSYKMDDPKKSYNVFLSYDNNKQLDALLINVDSTDPIYKKSTFFIEEKDLSKFRIFLLQVSAKQLEWDTDNLIHKESEVIKRIEVEQGFKLTCKYENGPIFPDAPLYITYAYIQGKSAVSISSPTFNEIESSQIFFLNNTSLKSFLNKLEDKEIQKIIISDFSKKSRLK